MLLLRQPLLRVPILGLPGGEIVYRNIPTTLWLSSESTRPTGYSDPVEAVVTLLDAPEGEVLVLDVDARQADLTPL